MVGLTALVGITSLALAADPIEPPMPPVSDHSAGASEALLDETATEREYYQAEADALKQEFRGESWSWETSVRAIDDVDKARRTWRATLGTDIPHPYVNRALRAEGLASIQEMQWNRAGLLRQRRLEEALSRVDVATAAAVAHIQSEELQAALEK